LQGASVIFLASHVITLFTQHSCCYMHQQLRCFSELTLCIMLWSASHACNASARLI
jgi:hypothetical protein